MARFESRIDEDWHHSAPRNSNPNTMSLFSLDEGASVGRHHQYEKTGDIDEKNDNDEAR